MNAKHLIPLSYRDQWRPSWQRLQRRWQESIWSPKPPYWRLIRNRVHHASDLDSLLKLAVSEFGLTQINSEIRGLIDLLSSHSPRTVVEVGTHKGGNSFLFCHALPTVQKAIGIDLCVQNSSKLIYYSRPKKVFQALHGDSQKEEMLLRLERLLGGQSVDFLFIDGDHTLQGVRTDFDLYSPLVRPGGIIAFHDIVPDHRTRFGLDTGCYSGEVYLFWQELKQHYECQELIDHPDQDGFGIGILQMPLNLGY